MSEKSKSKTMALVFDFGDVICFWKDDILSDHQSLLSGQPKDSIRKIIFEYLAAGGEGTYHSITDFIERAQPKTSATREVANQVFNEYEGTAQVDQRMIDLITQLKQQYKIGLLSNFPKGLEEYLVERFHIDHLFDAVVSSYNIQMTKPRLDGYYYIVNKLGVKPEHCLFVDDVKKNVLAAEQVGMKGILFKGFEDLVNQLNKKLEIKVLV